MRDSLEEVLAIMRNEVVSDGDMPVSVVDVIKHRPTLVILPTVVARDVDAHSLVMG